MNGKRAIMKCNGLEDLCDLRLDQITLPGSHNAGSGFDGKLYYWSGAIAASCSYRNHGKSFSQQLEFGIRYFDIDTCYGKTEAMNCHCNNGKDCAYAGSIEKGLSEINKWMNSHPYEIAVVHFNRDVQNYKVSDIYKSIAASLLKFWKPNTSGKLAMSTYYKNNNFQWPVVKDAISSNQRIFVFMDNKLYQYSLNVHREWLVKSNYLIASTWDTNPVSSSCSGITTNAEKKCSTTATFIDLSAFGSYGLCTWDMATICSKWLGEADEACYKLRVKNNKAVNFLLVDWLDYHKGGESVVNKAKFMNQKNIKKYLGKSIFFPELTGCSYHPGWLRNYCWKYCSEYGWCWINKYCGSDASVCQQQDYPCYSASCGYNG